MELLKAYRITGRNKSPFSGIRVLGGMIYLS